MTHTVESLTAFNERVKEAFLAKRIKAPVHLCDPNQANVLIPMFKDIRPQDWIFCTWRSSFHALLKGCPEEWVFNEILEGRSMYLMNVEHRVISSSIVGGILPIAAGVAEGIKRNIRDHYNRHGFIKSTDDATVWVFVGDMTATTGLFYEFAQYVEGQNLRVKIVIEDNELSTNTPTKKAWWKNETPRFCEASHYYYKRDVPHVGVGQRVEF